MTSRLILALCFGNGLVAPMYLTDSGQAPLLQLAQSQIEIPSDRQLEQLERQGIAVPPLDVSGAPAPQGTEESQIRRMDREDRVIDRGVMKGICSDC